MRWNKVSKERRPDVGGGRQQKLLLEGYDNVGF